MVRATINGMLADHGLSHELRETIGGLLSELDDLRKINDRQRLRLDSIDRELGLAAAVQRDFLPSSIPTLSRATVAALHQPADVVSGDFYDFFRIDESRLGVLVADATGHGVSAGLIAAFAHGAARRAVAAVPQDPSAVLARINAEMIAAELPGCQFVTAVYAIFDESNRTVRWARGGAPYPVLVNSDGAWLIDSDGPLLGAAPASSSDFPTVDCRLDAGETLLFFTDGVESLVEFTEERTPLSEPLDLPEFLGEIQDSLISAQPDDVTIVGLQAH